MKEFCTAILTCLATFQLLSQDIAIREVLYNEELGQDRFELVNTSSGTININGWWICARFGYRQMGSSSLQVVHGSLTLGPGDTVVMRLLDMDLHDTHSDFGIFLDGDFGSVESMVDFIQWGNGTDVGRGYVAVADNSWTDLDPGPGIDLDFIPVAAAGFSTQWDGTNGGGGELTLSTDFVNGESSLAVQLLELIGKVNMDKKVELIWISLDEYYSDKHFIEKSPDGQNYVVIGELPAQNLGSAPAHYHFLDESPVMNSYSYYRIRQVDHAGVEVLSTAIYLKVTDVPTHRMHISPMPISGFGCFNMELYWSREEALAKFRIIDMAGRVVEEFLEPVREGFNSVMHQFYGIEPGQYLMLISDKSDYCAQYFVIGK